MIHDSCPKRRAIVGRLKTICVPYDPHLMAPIRRPKEEHQFSSA
jgi:hypothetical protein